MFCTNCGKELEAGDLFCGYCGARQEPAQATQESPAVEEPAAGNEGPAVGGAAQGTQEGPAAPVASTSGAGAAVLKSNYSYRPIIYWLIDMILGFLGLGVGLAISFSMESYIGVFVGPIPLLICKLVPAINAVFYKELTLVGEKANIPVLTKKTVWGLGDYKAKYNHSRLASIHWSAGGFSKAVYEIGNGETISAYYEEYTTNCIEAGVSAIRAELDRAGNRIRMANYGMFGQLKKNREGIAIIENEYDGAGNMTREAYYGEDCQLTLDSDGVAIYEWEYDSAGNRIRQECYGVDGRLTLNSNGIAIYEWEYDSAGNMTRWENYGVDGRLVADSNGFAIVEYEYNGSGDTTRQTAYGVDGRLVADSQLRHR